MSIDIVLYTNKGVRIGDVLNASERKLTLPHMRTPTFSWTLPIDHVRVPRLLSEPCIVQVRRTDPRYPSAGSKVIYNGHVVSAEESGAGDTQTVAFGSAGPLWVLSRRVLALSIATGSDGYIFPRDINNKPIEPGEHPATIARDVIDQANNSSPRITVEGPGTYHTGIRLGTDTSPTLPSNSARRVVYIAQNKTAADALNELSAGASSFEWVITPIPLEPGVELFDGSNGRSEFPIIAKFDTGDVIGSKRSNAVFQFGGDGKTNVESYKRTVSRDGTTNNVYMPTIFDVGLKSEAFGVIQKTDYTSAHAYNLLDDIVSDNGIQSATLKTNLAQEHVNVRKNPREVVTFKPQMNAWPSPLTDYNVGDTVRCRAVVAGVVRFDRWMRVWGITLSLDANGNELVELELTMP